MLDVFHLRSIKVNCSRCTAAVRAENNLPSKVSHGAQHQSTSLKIIVIIIIIILVLIIVHVFQVDPDAG